METPKVLVPPRRTSWVTTKLRPSLFLRSSAVAGLPGAAWGSLGREGKGPGRKTEGSVIIWDLNYVSWEFNGAKWKFNGVEWKF